MRYTGTTNDRKFMHPAWLPVDWFVNVREGTTKYRGIVKRELDEKKFPQFLPLDVILERFLQGDLSGHSEGALPCNKSGKASTGDEKEFLLETTNPISVQEREPFDSCAGNNTIDLWPARSRARTAPPRATPPWLVRNNHDHINETEYEGEGATDQPRSYRIPLLIPKYPVRGLVNSAGGTSGDAGLVTFGPDEGKSAGPLIEILGKGAGIFGRTTIENSAQGGGTPVIIGRSDEIPGGAAPRYTSNNPTAETQKGPPSRTQQRTPSRTPKSTPSRTKKRTAAEAQIRTPDKTPVKPPTLTSKAERKKSRRSLLRRTARAMGVLVLLSVIVATAFVYDYVSKIEAGLPVLPDSPALKEPVSSIILASDGAELARFYKERRQWITLEEMSKNVVDALIATEDHRFFEHAGVDYFRLIGAAWNTMTGNIQGASTIPMQVARNAFPAVASSSAIDRKVKEIILARRLDSRFSKEEILEWYLNTVSFGNNSFGIEAAATTYFSKHAGELRLAEAALLVGMLKGPSRYDAFRNGGLAQERRNLVLRRMAETGKISWASFRQQAASGLQLNPTFYDPADSPAPFFTGIRKTDGSELGSEERIRSLPRRSHHPHYA